MSDRPLHLGSRTGPRTGWDLALVAGVLVGVWLRVRALAAGRSLWLDEMLLALNLRDRTLLSLLTEPMQFGQSAPPGYLVLGRIAAVLSGGSDAGIRTVALVAGVATIALAAFLAVRAVRSPALATGLAWSIAISPTLVYYSTELKQYATDVLAMLVVLLLWQHRATLGRATQAVLGFVVAVLSLPGAIALAALTTARVTVAVFGVGRGDPTGSPRGRLEGLRRIRGILVVWSFGIALHLAHGLTVGGDRDLMSDWWTLKGGFPPTPPWDRADLSWFTSSLSRLVWLAVGHDGRASPGMDRGPILLMLVVGLAVVLGLVLGRRDDGWELLPLITGIGAATFVASALRLYPFSSRLLLFLVPAVLVAIVVAADSVRTRPPARILTTAVVVLVLGLQAVVTVPRAAAPLDDRDVLEALSRAGAGPSGAHLVTYEPLMLDWYAAQVPGTVTTVLAGPEDLAPALAAVEEGRVPALWVVSTHRFEEAAADVAVLGGQRFVCVRSARETFVAAAIAPGVTAMVDCG